MKIFLTILLNMLMKIKKKIFYKQEFKSQIKFFSHNKLKFQPRT